MKLFSLILISIALLSNNVNAKPNYAFSNADQQTALEDSVYNLSKELQTKECKIFVQVQSEKDDAVFMVTDRHVYVEVRVYNNKKFKTLTYPELNLNNWMKFEYQVRQLVLEVC